MVLFFLSVGHSSAVVIVIEEVLGGGVEVVQSAQGFKTPRVYKSLVSCISLSCSQDLKPLNLACSHSGNSTRSSSGSVSVVVLVSVALEIPTHKVIHATYTLFLRGKCIDGKKE